MLPWIAWLLSGGVLVLAELFTGTFYLLMIAIGMAAGALAAWFGAGLEWQFVIAAIVSVAGTIVVRRSQFGKRQKVDSAKDRNVNLDIGQPINVDRWTEENAGGAADNVELYTARVKYRGALWDVELAPGEVAHSGQFFIQEIRGSRLIVASHSSR
ncbi:NfeD family protein [Glaciimonas immobilis]|uniref:Membrane protein implicated in regulation of membrane protease activity n=1 Tax=Glaciimonas immobilis TaxID=728004 RepID=A0A840RYN6_9BURK|nr:NfeD family protein [Glaciimonas immobilis]KAF3996249.1 NfeD family protein [Glaciimonas immobilis]MBB5202342.1 membrane protein implicated in regulation of membrane protease activity [Glaciimonas immobilis]